MPVTSIMRQHPDLAYEFYREGWQHAGQLGDDALAGWFQAAALGITGGVAAPHRTRVLGALLAVRVLDVGVRPDQFPPLLRAARAIASQVAASDPLPITARELHAALSQVMAPDIAVRQVMRLGAVLPAEDFQIVTRALLLAEDA